MKEIIIPIFAITALFVIPALVGLIAIRSWFKSRDRLYNSIDAAIDKDASPEVITQLITLTEQKGEKEDKSSPVKHFSDGAFWLALGIAFLVFYFRGGPIGLILPGIFGSLYGLAKFCIAGYKAKTDKPEK